MVQTRFGPELDLHWTEPLLNAVQVQVQSCWLKHVQFVFRFDEKFARTGLELDIGNFISVCINRRCLGIPPRRPKAEIFRNFFTVSQSSGEVFGFTQCFRWS